MNFRLSIFMLGISSFLVSCAKKDNTNPIPSITYESFSASSERAAQLTINFEDGDGDIFAEPGTKDNNFFAWFYYKDSSGEFKPALWAVNTPRPPLPDTTIYIEKPLSYTVIRPSELSKNQPIKGRITISLVDWRSNSAYKNFKYKIYMFDQKGNKTNELMTPEIINPF